MSMIDSPTQRSLGHFLDATVARYRQINQNLANIDTPGYKTRDINFQAALHHAENADEFSGGLLANDSPSAVPVRGLVERPDGNNVSLERETLLAAEVQLQFRLAVSLLKNEFHGIAQAIQSGGSTSS